MAIGVDKIHIINLDDVKFIQHHMVQYMNFVNLFKIIFNKIRTNCYKGNFYTNLEDFLSKLKEELE